MSLVQCTEILSGIRDTNGDPLSAGTVTFYEAGTTTLKNVYQDVDGSSAHSNPMTLDANGREEVWLEGAFKFLIKDSGGTTVYTWDDLLFTYNTGGLVWAGSSGGSSSAYTLSPSPSASAYNAGDTYQFTANHTSDGNATVNVSSLGAKSIYIHGGEVPAGGIQNGQTYTLTYDGTRFILQSPMYFAPTLQDWTPTIGAQGGTIGTTSVNFAKYFRIGNMVWFTISITGTTASTPSWVEATLPVNVTHTTDQWVAGSNDSGGFDTAVGCKIDASDDKIQWFEHDGTAWADAVMSFYASGWYVVST